MALSALADRNSSVVDSVADVLKSSGLVVHCDPAADQARVGRFQPWSSSSLHSAIRSYSQHEFPTGLFTHQQAAIENILAGRHTVVATRTSSGKSLIYALPVFDALCRDPQATALFLYPQKALANDQRIKLHEIARKVEPIRQLTAANARLISRYDGATPGDDRPDIRRQAQVLLTNPDMLHLGILQHHDRFWERFFANLQVVAIDECHEYRGVFGTNVAYILHRLRQICALHGSSPRFVATSATVHEPREHLERLTGVPFTCVDAAQDGSQQGRRKFWMVGDGEHYYDTGRKLALALAEAGLTVLAFCPSRVSAERMLARLPKAAAEERSPLRVYRSGLSATDREEIEAGLRDRSIRVVFSTSALELGIDIGAIDVVLCIGLPNSMMSLWQRAGRTARGGREGATILIPADTPIDSYYAEHPDEFFGREHEPLALNLTNQRIVCQHYACALREVGGDEPRLRVDVLGAEMSRVHELRSQGKLNREELYRDDPHCEINIRSAGEGSYSLMVGEEKIGEIDSFHLLREAYRNAIYRHGGRAFRVQDVIRGRKIVRLQPERTRHETYPFVQKQIRVKQQFSQADYSGLRVATAAIDVTERLMAVTEKDPAGETVRTWQGSLGMPPHQLPTEGTFVLFKPELWLQLTAELKGAVLGALQSCERLLCNLFPTISGPCDVQDFSSGVERLPTGEYAVFLYDRVYDGVGLTRVAFDKIDQLVDKACERLESCRCETDAGCIRCIANPLAEEPSSKSATRTMLQRLREVLRDETPRISRADTDWTAGLTPDAASTCPACHTTAPPHARFCPNCGSRLEVKG